MGAGRKHLQAAGLGYAAHLLRALAIGRRLIGGGVAAMVHGVFPGLYQTRAGEIIDALHREAELDRAKRESRARSESAPS